MEASDDNDEYDEDYEEEGRSNDALLRKLGCFVKGTLRTKNYQKAEDGFEIVEISCKAYKMSDKDWLWLGWQGG